MITESIFSNQTSLEWSNCNARALTCK